MTQWRLLPTVGWWLHIQYNPFRSGLYVVISLIWTYDEVTLEIEEVYSQILLYLFHDANQLEKDNSFRFSPQKSGLIV